MECDADELIIKGKQQCNGNNFGLGIKCFEAALAKGLKDRNLIMSVQNELGNAYFSMKDYDKAMDNFTKNVELSKENKEKYVESMAHGNLSMVLKMLGKFDEAVVHCNIYLNASLEINNKAEIAKALCNMGSIFYDNAKSKGAIIRDEIAQFPPEIEDLLVKASEYYKEALSVNRGLTDKLLRSSILGNYANVQYLMNNFQKSIKLNSEKLKLAKDLHDQESERRTYVNRGNVYVVMKSYDSAIQDYKKALDITRLNKDEANEMKLLYTLGNTYSISGKFKKAIEIMLSYHSIVRNNDAKFSEARANFCLSILYSEVGDYHTSRVYAVKHEEISTTLNDNTESEIAKDNLQRIDNMIKYSDDQSLTTPTKSKSNLIFLPKKMRIFNNIYSVNLPDLINIDNLTNSDLLKTRQPIEMKDESDSSSDKMYSILKEFKTRELANQKTNFNSGDLEEEFKNHISSSKKIFLDALMNYQGRRMDDQRFDISSFRKNCK